MKQACFNILSNEQLTSSVYKMVLEGDTSAITAPGQFVEIAIEGTYLRRPISICDYDATTLTLIYKVVGEGTGIMSRMEPGKKLDLLVGLGNGFDTSKCSSKALLVGGGVGVPPMFNLARKLLSEGRKVSVILGFNTVSEAFFVEEFESLGLDVKLTTVDGSAGIKGFVTDALYSVDYDYFFACGPIPMLKALSSAASTSGMVSLEERMGCGFGACMGCTHKMVSGNKRICKDGPVFEKEDVIW